MNNALISSSFFYRISDRSLKNAFSIWSNCSAKSFLMSMNYFLIDFINISMSSFYFLVDLMYSSSFYFSCSRNCSIKASFCTMICLQASFCTSMSFLNKILSLFSNFTYLSQFFTVLLFFEFLPCPIDFYVLFVASDNL